MSQSYDVPAKEIGHKFLKAGDWDRWKRGDTDQRKKVPRPPLQKQYPQNAILIDLIQPEKLSIGDVSLKNIINQRRSRRRFTKEEFSLEELSYLLWATQGISILLKDADDNVAVQRRTIPSSGARNPFETYLVINRVDGIIPGLYSYLPVDHKLVYLKCNNDFIENIVCACGNQKFVADSAVMFIWAAIPYRTEWRYSFLSYKSIAIEIGHVCQNLYLAAESIGGGTCAIDTYNQEKMDRFIDVDGQNEFTVYVAATGKIKKWPKIVLTEKELDAFVGRYEINSEQSIAIFREGKSLYSQVGQGAKLELSPQPDDVFLYKLFETEITFVKNSDGEVEHYYFFRGDEKICRNKITD